METQPIKLTQFSPGAGCGCKIAPQILEQILKSESSLSESENERDPRLLVGHETKDDAAVYDLENGMGLISTTDFFTPIVDDPFDFGRIAAVNAISDVYAMGGTPVLAIGILGWPLSKLPPEVAKEVLRGAKEVCKEAGIALAGGHSIEIADPIFGLAVNGLVKLEHLKKNASATAGCQLILTKPLGVGLITTAEKRGLLKDKSHQALALKWMTTLNKVGAEVAKIVGVQAMTDVTGFGLLGHLLEMCEGSGLSAELYWNKIPKLPDIEFYITNGCVPGGSKRNWKSYGDKVGVMSDFQRDLLTDPQTSGGLLIAVEKESLASVQAILKKSDLYFDVIGSLGEYLDKSNGPITILN